MADIDFDLFQQKTVIDNIDTPKNVYKLTHDLSLEDLKSPIDEDELKYVINRVTHDVEDNTLKDRGEMMMSTGEYEDVDEPPRSPMGSPMSVSTCSVRSLAEELQESYQLSETGSKLPETGPKLPETGPKLPETGPKLPETGPKLPETGPKLPETGPKLPETGCEVYVTGGQRPNFMANQIRADASSDVDDDDDEDLSRKNAVPSSLIRGKDCDDSIKIEGSALLRSDNKLLCEDGSGTCHYYSDTKVVVTHRALHKFVPRHSDEVDLDVGDLLCVKQECDDLWCEAINLRSGKSGIFPCAYACDVDYDAMFEQKCFRAKTERFSMKFLGSVEVSCHKGNEVLCQAMSKVAQTRRVTLNSQPPPICVLEINQHGVRMADRGNDKYSGGIKETLGRMFGRSKQDMMASYDHFFSLKNITFCGYHPKNHRYFGFITKHPSQSRYACHVFISDKTTHRVAEAIGRAFHHYFDEFRKYTASSHPTEDIYME